jgi:hypothetical protein
LQNWLNFINILFWILLFFFLLNSYNIVQLLFLSEIVWILLYTLTTILSSFTDDLILLTLSFFILGLSGLEFSFGIILVIVYNFFKKTTNITDKKKKLFDNKLNLNIKRYTHIN